MSKFYVYTVAEPPQRGGAVFYIGKGSGHRWRVYLLPRTAFKSFLNPQLKERLRAIYDAGLLPMVERVFETDSEQAAYDEEYRLICEYRPQLLNKWWRRSISIQKGGRRRHLPS